MLLESIFSETFACELPHWGAPAAKPTEPDHAKRSALSKTSGSVRLCASPPNRGSASRGTRTASSALIAATDNGALWPAQISKKNTWWELVPRRLVL